MDYNVTGKRCVFKIKEIMEKEIKKLSVNSLAEYVNKNRTQDECIGFIDGFAEAVRLLKKHGFLTDVIVSDFCECEGVQDLQAMTGECRKCGKECDY